MIRKGIAEIIAEAGKKRKNVEKIEYLRSENHPVLTGTLKMAYSNIPEFALPETRPPFTPLAKNVDAQGMYYGEFRRMYLFFKPEHGGHPNIDQLKREELFIGLLESVDPDDAEMILLMKNKMPFKGLTKDTINKAFPGLIE